MILKEKRKKLKMAEVPDHQNCANPIGTAAAFKFSSIAALHLTAKPYQGLPGWRDDQKKMVAQLLLKHDIPEEQTLLGSCEASLQLLHICHVLSVR